MSHKNKWSGVHLVVHFNKAVFGYKDRHEASALIGAWTLNIHTKESDYQTLKHDPKKLKTVVNKELRQKGFHRLVPLVNKVEVRKRVLSEKHDLPYYTNQFPLKELT